MNERIKELEKQCWDNQTNHLNAEKFAELIVGECVDIVADTVDHREPASTYVNKIKQHFGIITSNNSVMEKKSERAAKQHEEGAVGCSGDDVHDNPWKGINMPPPMNVS
jgi:ElaB/YqjD/DUF883 family membrane-anchored ribosome-binding protein